MLAELEIVEQLCRGIDPRTGEILSTPKSPEVDAARLRFLGKLKTLNRNTTSSAASRGVAKPPGLVDQNFPNRGKKWADEDVQKLCELWSSGKTLDSMAPEFGRTAGALAAKLMDEGWSPDVNVIRAENVRRGGEYGKILAANASQAA